ncbi:Holliday junction resolvase RuvX [Candidatus Peregrinibacteria bacterium CG10_big_fil_rev_8_21_14_0_10_36_19]|nr:MAG: Holliday junction resolvase RuvX [Candidatus Peregrinibacteria bacterium CG10_big_fil_rev_8_21_14_0_10_36_19]
MRVLSLDYGSKKVGVATGDSDLKISFPRDVIVNEGMDLLLKKVKSLLSEYGCEMVVVGLPLNVGGDDNPILNDVKRFVSLLTENGVKVELFDETLSSFEADALMKDALEKNGRNELKRDAFAALVILQRFFEKSF